jgi:hypothetical protein
VTRNAAEWSRTTKGDAVGTQIKSGLAKLKSNGTLARLATKYKIPASDVS